MKHYLDRSWLTDSYLSKGLGQKAIGDICGVDQSTIHKYLKRFNIPCRGFHGRSGKFNANYRGGRYLSSQGYVHVLMPEHPLAMKSRNYVPEHVLVVEKAIGRFLSRGEAVHHLNEVKDDNRVENLYLFPSESDHQRYHRLLHFGKVARISESNLLSGNG